MKKYNIDDICTEIIEYWDYTTWIGIIDINNYLDKYYGDIDDKTRLDVIKHMDDECIDVNEYETLEDCDN